MFFSTGFVIGTVILGIAYLVIGERIIFYMVCGWGTLAIAAIITGW